MGIADLADDDFAEWYFFGKAMSIFQGIASLSSH
jgi:hypothetical protein